MNLPNYNIAEGVYHVQYGHKKDTAIIKCPYIPYRIEVYQSCSLKILDGAQVYWTEIRQFRRKKQTVIQAAVVSLKNCQYICQAKQVPCSLKMIEPQPGQQGQANYVIEGHPINKKLPNLQITNGQQLISWAKGLNANLQEGSDKTNFIKTIEGKYFWARIVAWNFQQSQPRAIITQVFNQNDTKTVEAETEIILHTLGIKDKNDSEKLQILRGKKQKPYFPVHGHKQFKKMVFTIDPQHSQDVQDALSVQLIDKDQFQSDLMSQIQYPFLSRKSNCSNASTSSERSSKTKKIYEVGVHISDVTAYLPLLEDKRQEIAKQGSSIYLPQKVINMFPDQIVRMCTLFPKQKKLAISVLFKMDEEGNVLSEPKFKKSIIKNVAKMSYQEAEQIIKGVQDANQVQRFMKKHKITQKEYDSLSEKLIILKNLSNKRRNVRLNYRSYSIPYKNQITFKLDTDNFPVSIGIKKGLDSQKLVEQFMILTNQSVAKKLVKDYGQNSLIIHHPKPTDNSLQYFSQFLSEFGLRFTTKSAKDFQNQIGKILGEENVKEQVKQLLLVRAMHIQEHASYTRYMHGQRGHFGLNLQYYTHFTSPLRRFADIIVHQQLLQTFKDKRIKTETSVLSYKKINQNTERLLLEIEYANKARFRNKKLKQMVVECFINMLLHKQKKKLKAKGLILSLGLKSANVYIPGYHIVKEVEWKSKAEYLEKEGIRVNLQTENPESQNWVQFQRNDSVDIQIESEQHQQVKVSILVDGKPL